MTKISGLKMFRWLTSRIVEAVVGVFDRVVFLLGDARAHQEQQRNCHKFSPKHFLTGPNEF